MANWRDWSIVRAKCLLCGHPNCPACREVSFSILACCQCRPKVIERLQELERQDRSSSENC
jgi:hypothetical protein